jgi:hypothetical protein
MAVIQTKLQDTVDNLKNWSKQNGFRFSQTKTVMVHIFAACDHDGNHLGPKNLLERSRY